MNALSVGFPGGRKSSVIPLLRIGFSVVTGSRDHRRGTAYYRLLLFTGLRKSEAAALRWKDIHEDRLHIPMTKNGRPFDLPILEIHHAILAPLRRLDPEWVFPARGSAAGHLHSPKRIDWSPHAHRRAFAIVGMEAGVIEEIVGWLLNHTPLPISGHRYLRPSPEALRPAMPAICMELHKRTTTK